MNRYRSSSPSPAEIASAQRQKDIADLFSSHTSEQVKKQLRMYENLFKPQKSISYTSSQTTMNILKKSRLPYYPPQKADERVEALKQAALDHKDSKGVAETARREVDREVAVAMKRVQNKQLKESIQLGHKKALSDKIKRIDDNVDYIVALYKTINLKRSKEDDERARLQEKLKQVRQEQSMQMQRVREESLLEKIGEMKKIQAMSQQNEQLIKKKNEETIAENVQKKQRMIQASKSNVNLRDRSFNSNISMRTESTPKSKIEDQIQFATKVLTKLKGEEAKIDESLRHNFAESIRMKTELGLIVHQRNSPNNSRIEHDQSRQNASQSQSQFNEANK